MTCAATVLCCVSGCCSPLSGTAGVSSPAGASTGAGSFAGGAGISVSSNLKVLSSNFKSVLDCPVSVFCCSCGVCRLRLCSGSGCSEETPRTLNRSSVCSICSTASSVLSLILVSELSARLRATAPSREYFMTRFPLAFNAFPAISHLLSQWIMY